MVRTSIEKPIMSDIASNTVIPIPPYKLGVRLVQKLEKEKYCMFSILSRNVNRNKNRNYYFLQLLLGQ